MNNRNNRNEDIRSTKIQVVAEKLLAEESLADENVPGSSLADQLTSTRTPSAKESSFGHTFRSVLSPIASNNMQKGMNENVENEDPENNYSDISSNLELNTNFAATTFSTSTRSRNASKICDKFSLISFHDESLHNSQDEIENPSNKTFLIASAQSSICNEHSTSRKKISNAVLNETYSINSSPSLQEDLIDLNSTEVLSYGTENQNLIELSKSQNVELSKNPNLELSKNPNLELSKNPNLELSKTQNLQLSADEKVPECSEKLESSELEKENCITPGDGNHQTLVEESVTRKSEGAAEILQGTGARLRDPNSENPEAPEECAQMFNNNATTVSVNHHISNASQIKRRSSKSVTFCRSSLLQKSLNDKSENTRKSQFEDFTTVTPFGTLSALPLHADGSSVTESGTPQQHSGVPCETLSLTAINTVGQYVDTHPFEVTKRWSRDPRPEISKSILAPEVSFLTSPKTRKTASPKGMKSFNQISTIGAIDERDEDLGTVNMNVLSESGLNLVVSFFNSTKDIPYAETDDSCETNKNSVTADMRCSVKNARKLSLSKSPVDSQVSGQKSKQDSVFSPIEEMSPVNKSKKLTCEPVHCDTPISSIFDTSKLREVFDLEERLGVMTRSRSRSSTQSFFSNSQTQDPIKVINSAEKNLEKSLGLTAIFTSPSSQLRNAHENEKLQPRNGDPANPSPLIGDITADIEDANPTTNQEMNAAVVGSRKTFCKKKRKAVSCPNIAPVSVASTGATSEGNEVSFFKSRRSTTSVGEKLVHDNRFNLESNNESAFSQHSGCRRSQRISQSKSDTFSSSVRSQSAQKLPERSAETEVFECHGRTVTDSCEDPSKNELGSSLFLQRKSVTLNISGRSPFTRAQWEENQMSETSADSPKNEMTRELTVNARKDAERILADLSIGDTRKERSDITSICIQSDDNPQSDIQFFSMGTGTQTSFSFSDNVKRRKTETRQSFGMQTTKLPSDFTVERKSLGMQTTKRCSSSPSRRCLKEIGVQNSPWGNQSEPPRKTRRSSYFRDSYRSFGCHTEIFPSPAEVECMDAEVFSCPGEVDREVSETTIVPKKIASDSGLRNELSESTSHFLVDKPERGQDDSNSKCDESKECQPLEKSTGNCNDESPLKSNPFETCTRSMRRNRAARGARGSKNQSVREIGSVESGISSESRTSSISKSKCTSSIWCEQVPDEKTDRLDKSLVCQVERSWKSDILKLETEAGLKDLEVLENYEVPKASSNKKSEVSKSLSRRAKSQEEAKNHVMPLPRSHLKSTSTLELSLDPHKKLLSSTRITPKPKQKPSESPKEKKRQPAKKQNRRHPDNDRPVYFFMDDKTRKPIYVPLDYELNYVIWAPHHQTKEKFQYYSK